MSEVNQVSAADTFNGDNNHLISCIKSLLSLDEKGALVPHGVGGHARTMLSSAAQRLADFDRVTAERDVSLGREAALREDLEKQIARTNDFSSKLTGSQQLLTESHQREAALQALLTAADERADVLEGLLRDALLYSPSHGMGSVTFELNKRIIAALKPAEGGGDDS